MLEVISISLECCYSREGGSGDHQNHDHPLARNGSAQTCADHQPGSCRRLDWLELCYFVPPYVYTLYYSYYSIILSTYSTSILLLYSLHPLLSRLTTGCAGSIFSSGWWCLLVSGRRRRIISIMRCWCSRVTLPRSSHQTFSLPPRQPSAAQLSSAPEL